MLPIFVVLWKQGGEVREAEGGGLNVIHGDATTVWHVTLGSFRRRAGVGFRPIAASRLSELPSPNRAFAYTADGQQSAVESGVVGAAHWPDAPGSLNRKRSHLNGRLALQLPGAPMPATQSKQSLRNRQFRLIYGHKNFLQGGFYRHPWCRYGG